MNEEKDSERVKNLGAFHWRKKAFFLDSDNLGKASIAPEWGKPFKMRPKRKATRYRSSLLPKRKKDAIRVGRPEVVCANCKRIEGRWIVGKIKSNQEKKASNFSSH